MFQEKLKFQNGLVIFHNLQFIISPMNSFLCIINEIIENEDPEFLEKTIINATKKDTYVLYSQLNNKTTNNNKKITLFLEILNSFGYGEIKLKYLTKNKIIFIEKEPYLNNLYKLLYKKEPKINLELITLGYLKHFIEFISKKKVNYIIKKTNIISYTLILENETIETPKNNYKLKLPNNTNNPSAILQKIITNKQLKTVNGQLLLWNTYAILIPYCFFIDLTSKLPPKYEIFFKNLSAMQGKAAVGLQKSIFGIQKEKMFKQIIEQTELIGIGETNLKKNKNGLKFTLNNNLDYYLKNKIYTSKDIVMIKTYFDNLIKGAFDFSYNVETIIENSNNLNIKTNTRELTSQEKNIDKYINSKALITKTS